MKKIYAIPFIFIILLSCEITTEPQTINLNENSAQLEWIKFRSSNAWYLEGNASLFNDVTGKKYECSSIELFPTSQFFIYEVNSEKMYQEIFDGPLSGADWVWKEKQ